MTGRRGLYQSLVTEVLKTELAKLDGRLRAQLSDLRHAEASDRIAMHLAMVVERVIDAIDQKTRVQDGIALVRDLIARAVENLDEDLLLEQPATPGQYLSAILAILPDGTSEALTEPLIPLLDTALLTNSPGEPRVGSQILAEIPSADRIDLVMAFIRRSGIAPVMDALRRHCEAGRPLHVLTTVYTGSTEALALEELSKIGAQVRVSYDTGNTRLHAKAWLFHRESGFSTAYIGSSNLTHSAQVSGLEWNARFSGARNPSVIDKVAAVFDSYWHSGDFVPFDKEEFELRTQPHHGIPEFILSPIEIRLEPFQERLLEQIALARQQGHHRNLLVSATGTGKTVMAAVDYARLKEKLPRARLLFVAHRMEILVQSQATFRHALRDHAFGELWVGGARPEMFDHVFASIQSLNAAGFEAMDPEHFDVIVVDEFHHAEARSYRRLLDHVRPRELLGLTATPERADCISVADWFDGRIAAELRLWDAVDQHRLVPFAYYGIADDLDFTKVAWQRGHGYDIEGLTNVYTANDAWARLVIKRLTERVDEIGRMRALGFCVSVAHARFMSRIFNESGITAKAIWADTPAAEREAALRELRDRQINVLFSVDLFNEGVDLPEVDTLLMLRPTDSATLFLQQLGRGLRRYPEKTICTVLDFVGLHRREFRFDRRLGAVVGGTRAHMMRQIQQGFPFLPAGCHMELDRVASERVLENIRNAVPSQWTRKIEELRKLAARRTSVPLREYLAETGLTLEDLYANNRSWSDLCEAAGLKTLSPGPNEEELRRACGRLLHIDDAPRIDAYQRLVDAGAATLPGTDRRLLRMIVASVIGSTVDSKASLDAASDVLWQHPQVIAEIRELLEVLRDRIDHVAMPLEQNPTLPLHVHARYTRIEIQAAFGDGSNARVPTWREGVRWMAGENADVFVFTLDKTSGAFSPTTRYRDYAISPELVHWESQSTTRADSPTGRRYQTHKASGTSVMLFARLTDEDRAFYFLGPAEYVSHEGEMPMAVTWRLKYALPGDLFASFAAAVA